MYTIPETFDLDILKNANVQQICFAANNVSIFFEKIGFIQLEGEFIYHDENSGIHQFHCYPITSQFGILLSLLEKQVSGIKTNKQRNNLFIYFNDEMIEIYGNPNYESYIININGENLII